MIPLKEKTAHWLKGSGKKEMRKVALELGS